MKNSLQYSSRQANKALSISNFQENEDKVCPLYRQNVRSYEKKFTPAIKKVYVVVISRRSRHGVSLKNVDIAKLAGVSTKTVKRATNKLQEDGLIRKEHPYARSLNIYYYNNIVNKSVSAFISWFDLLSPKEKEIYTVEGKEGLERHNENLVPLLSEDEDTMTKDLTRIQKMSYQSPLSVKDVVFITELYKTPKVKKSSNGNDEGFDLVVWHYGDKSVYETSVEENIHPNGSDTFCFLCESDLDKCICTDKIEGDKTMDSPYIH